MLVRNNIDYDQDIEGSFKFTEGGPLVLLDGDPIAYSSAAACDNATHYIKLNGVDLYHVEGGITDLYAALGFNDYRDFGEMLESNPHITYDKVVDSDDSGNMKHTIKAQVRKIIEKTGAGSIRIFLTDGDTNFRLTEEIATVLKYKGNRSSDSKPKQLGEARKYMLEELDAIMCVGLEADDQISIEHRQDWERAMSDAKEFYLGEANVPQEELERKAMELTSTLLVTIDKDIKMCAGKFMNPSQDLGVEEIYPLGHMWLDTSKKAGKVVKKLRFNGLKGFYAQILSGDTCDNIPNVYFCGDTRVFEVLGECKDEESLFKATLREIYHGFKREHIQSLDEEIKSRTQKAIASGKHGKDNVSNTAKVRKKIKDTITKQAAFLDKHYYHWSEYKIKEDGTVSKDLVCDNPKVLTISPIDYMIEVARLVYMLDTPPNENGDHLWTPPNQQWVDDVVEEFETENLLRIPMAWEL